MRKLRYEGKVPANIYGPEFKSQAVTIDHIAFNRVYRAAEETGVVYLRLNSKDLPVLIKSVQRHPVTNKVLHVDFRKIDLTQKIETEVPIKLVGESPAVVQKGGVLNTQVDGLLVEALPSDIPHEIEIDISKLQEIGSEIKVADLPKSDKFVVKDEPEKLIVSIIEHKEESLAPETAVAEPEVITEKEAEEAEAEAAEAEAPAEEAPKEEKPQQEAAKAEKPKKE